MLSSFIAVSLLAHLGFGSVISMPVPEFQVRAASAQQKTIVRPKINVPHTIKKAPIKKKPVVQKKIIQKTIKKLPPKVVAPTPAVDLTPVGIISATNAARQGQGVSGTLTENAQLSIAAAERLKDMFEKQYFEHNAPDGTRPAQVAERAGYQYIHFAENIAYGGFKSDQEIVTAWMNSPGHRANIVKPVFSEIGVAVGKGKLFGHDVWLGVQLFGKPASACPAPDEILHKKIQDRNAQIDELDAQARKIFVELETTDPQTNEAVAEYNKKVGVYNSLVIEIQNKVAEIKKEHQTYNTQIDAFNACINAPV